MNREDIMANNNAASEKVVTKYDRKMQKRKEEERKEAKRSISLSRFYPA